MLDEIRDAAGKIAGSHEEVGGDPFVLIKIEGMHCHKCEQSIKKSLQKRPGVHEVEVDFASGQASVLFDRSAISIAQIMDAVKETGYQPTGFTQSHAGPASAP